VYRPQANAVPFQQTAVEYDVSLAVEYDVSLEYNG